MGSALAAPPVEKEYELETTYPQVTSCFNANIGRIFLGPKFFFNKFAFLIIFVILVQ